MSLRKTLENFDGTRIETLELLLSEHGNSNSFIRKLVLLVADSDPKVQTAATWLLKRLGETDARFTDQQLIALYGLLPELTEWLSKLHILQLLQYIKIPIESARDIAWFLEHNLEDENKFLRAWVYNGYYELARQHKEFLDLASEQLDRGEKDKAAAVRARIRNIRKTLNKVNLED